MRKINLVSIIVLTCIACHSMAEINSACLKFYSVKNKNTEVTQIDAMVVKLKLTMDRTGKNLSQALIHLISTDPEFRGTRSQIPEFDKKLKQALAKPKVPEVVVKEDETPLNKLAAETVEPIKTPGVNQTEQSVPSSDPAVSPVQTKPVSRPPVVPNVATVLKNHYHTFDVRKDTYLDWLYKKINNISYVSFDPIILGAENLEYVKYFTPAERKDLVQEMEIWKYSPDVQIKRAYDNIQSFMSYLQSATANKLDAMETIGFLDVKSTADTKKQAEIMWQLFTNRDGLAWAKSKGYDKYLLNLTKQSDHAKLTELFETNIHERLFKSNAITDSEFMNALLPIIKNKKLSSDLRTKAAFKLLMNIVSEGKGNVLNDLSFLNDFSAQDKANLASYLKTGHLNPPNVQAIDLAVVEKFNDRLIIPNEINGVRQHNVPLLEVMHDLGVITFDPSDLFVVTRGKNLFFKGAYGDPTPNLTAWMQKKGFFQKFENMKNSNQISDRNAYMTLRSHGLMNVDGAYTNYGEAVVAFRKELNQTMEDKSLSPDIRMHAFMMGMLFKHRYEYDKYMSLYRHDIMFAPENKLSESFKIQLQQKKEDTDRWGGEVELSLDSFSKDEVRQLTNKFYAWIRDPRVVTHFGQSNDILVKQISSFVTGLNKLWFESFYAADAEAFRLMVDLQLVTLNTKNHKNQSVFEMALAGNQIEMMDIILTHPSAVDAMKNEPAYYHQLTGNHYPPTYTGQIQPVGLITQAHQMGRHEIAAMMEKIKEIKPMGIKKVGRKWNGLAPVHFIVIPKPQMSNTHYYERRRRNRVEISPNFEVMSTKVNRKMWNEVGKLGGKRLGRQDFLLEMLDREKNPVKRVLNNAKNMSHLWDFETMRDDEVTRSDIYQWIQILNNLSTPYYGGEADKNVTKKLAKLFPGHKAGMYYRLLEPGEFEQLTQVLPAQKYIPGSKESDSFDQFDDKNIVYKNGQPIFQLNETAGEMTLNLRGREPYMSQEQKTGRYGRGNLLVVPIDYFVKSDVSDDGLRPQVLTLGGFRLVREMTKPSDYHP